MRKPWDRADEESTAWHELTKHFPKSHPLSKRTWLLTGWGSSSNIYALKGKYLTLVDTGNDYTAFMELFELKGFSPEGVKKIALTHCHNDHTLGLIELLRSYKDFADFEVLVHESASSGSLNGLVRSFGRGGRVQGVGGGDVVNLSGWKFKVIHTPGHTADSICLLHEPSGTIFSGDTATTYPNTISAPDPRLGGSLGGLIVSVRSLSKMSVRHVLPGHGAPLYNTGQSLIQYIYEEALKALAKGGNWLQAALECVKMGLAEDALFCLDEALKLDPNKAEALGLKGACLSDMSRFDEALSCFEEVLKRDGGNALSWSSKGFILIKLRRYDEALSCFRKALAVNPTLENALHGKLLVLRELGKHQEADRMLRALKTTGDSKGRVTRT